MSSVKILLLFPMRTANMESLLDVEIALVVHLLTDLVFELSLKK